MSKNDNSKNGIELVSEKEINAQNFHEIQWGEEFVISLDCWKEFRKIDDMHIVDIYRENTGRIMLRVRYGEEDKNSEWQRIDMNCTFCREYLLTDGKDMNAAGIVDLPYPIYVHSEYEGRITLAPGNVFPLKYCPECGRRLKR